MNNKMKQIIALTSKTKTVSRLVGADPSVCPPKINLPSIHKSPIPSFPNVSVGNPFSTQCASLTSDLPSFLVSFCLFAIPFFNKIKAKIVLIMFVLIFGSIQLFAANAANWAAFAPLWTAASGADLNIILTGNISVGANIGAVGRTNLIVIGNNTSRWSFNGGQYSGFSISGRSVTFQTHLGLTNFYNPQNGGAMNISNGGQVYINVSTLTATNNTGGSGNSGTMTDSTRGGGVFAVSGSGSKLTINAGYAFFTGNTGQVDSGVIHILGSSVTLAGGEMIFKENTASYMTGNGRGGGAIRLTGNGADTAYLTISVGTITFDNNFSHDGSSILLQDAQTVLHVTSMTKKMNVINGASSYGAIYNRDGSMIFEAKEILIYNNQATGNGGAIFLGSPQGKITFRDTKITLDNNRSATNGGMLYAADASGQIIFENSLVYGTSNTANNGGIIYTVAGILLTFMNSTSVFIGNTAYNFGGSIYSSGDLKFERGGIEFTSNVSLATNSQGNIAVVGGTFQILDMYSMIGRYNRAASGGFLYVPNLAFNFNGALMEMIGNTAFGSGAYGRGGSFYLNGATAT
ncbi:MAG: hypothetical protein LBV16_07675, partial [Elusimicrobiota bacterium]|nr:hypothetical protein [Elusimicrobiota bacterium]